jgi:hypothetical protein
LIIFSKCPSCVDLRGILPGQHGRGQLCRDRCCKSRLGQSAMVMKSHSKILCSCFFRANLCCTVVVAANEMVLSNISYAGPRVPFDVALGCVTSDFWLLDSWLVPHHLIHFDTEPLICSPLVSLTCSEALLIDTVGINCTSSEVSIH